MTELTFELPNYIDDEGGFGATLVLAAQEIHEVDVCPLTNLPFSYSTLDLSNAMLFIYDKDGGVLREMEVNPEDYINETDIWEELGLAIGER